MQLMLERLVDNQWYITDMAFAESLKLEVKTRAAFRCCRCHNIGVEIHHIIPQADGGPDVIENAAPLCPNCHDYFGANPVKRKEITEMRDWWYGIVSAKYGPDGVDNQALLEKITEDLAAIRNDRSEDTQALAELKQSLKDLAGQIIDSVSPDNADEAVSELLEISDLRLANISDLRQGPIRHDSLQESYLNRIKVIFWTFSEYLDIPLDQTIENFQRDVHPEREIEVWERMATVILELKNQYRWDQQKVKAAVRLVLVLSTGPVSGEMKKDVKLSDEEVQLVLGLWGDAPTVPITVAKK